MLGKVLKYDLKSMGKELIPLYLVVLILGVLNRVFSILNDKFVILNVLRGAILVIFVLTLVGAFFYTFIVAIKRFYKNMLKDEGYLTNTLPVKKSSLLASKIISSVICIIITVAIILLALAIAFYTEGAITLIWEQVSSLITMLGLNPIAVIVVGSLLMLLSYMNYILMVYTALSLGQLRNTNKIMYSVVYGILIYIAIEIVSVIGLGILLLINPDLLNMLEQTQPPVQAMLQLFSVSGTVSVVFAITYCCITSYILNKKLNLE